MPDKSATTPVPSLRRIAGSVIAGTILAALLWATVPLSNSLAGSYVWETHYAYLVATPGHIDAFDPGQRPDLDGYSFVDPDAAAEAYARWERDKTHTNFFDRANTFEVQYTEPSHPWASSLDRIDLRNETAHLDTLDLSLPWLRMVTLEYQAGNRDRVRRIAGREYIGHETAAAAYLQKHAPWSSVGSLLAKRTYSFPKLELDPRFLWIPILQIGLFLGTTLAIGIAARETSRLRRRARRPAAELEPTTLTP